jgi:hypothetical protein
LLLFFVFFWPLGNRQKNPMWIVHTYEGFFWEKKCQVTRFPGIVFLKLQYLNNRFDAVTKINEPMGVALLIKAFQLYQESTPNFHNLKKNLTKYLVMKILKIQ